MSPAGKAYSSGMCENRTGGDGVSRPPIGDEFELSPPKQYVDYCATPFAPVTEKINTFSNIHAYRGSPVPVFQLQDFMK